MVLDTETRLAQMERDHEVQTPTDPSATGKNTVIGRQDCIRTGARKA